ncbi:MAG: hypothetical protein ACKO8I_00850 [Cyanobacteriota bacterium]
MLRQQVRALGLTVGISGFMGMAICLLAVLTLVDHDGAPGDASIRASDIQASSC